MRLKNQTREFRLYLYDPAGEEFTSIDRSSGQQFLFFEDLTGIVLVVDPLALPAFHEYAIARPQDVSAAMPGPSVPLGDIVGGLVRYERKFLKYGRTSRRDVPLAVVVAKADLPLVAEGVERSAGQNGGDGPLCRKALLSWGAANEVMWLEHEFRRIRYFSCSSLGRAPSETDSRPFVPQRVLPPLLWVMEESTKPG
jgi:hypothetical protein